MYELTITPRNQNAKMTLFRYWLKINFPKSGSVYSVGSCADENSASVFFNAEPTEAEKLQIETYYSSMPSTNYSPDQGKKDDTFLSLASQELATLTLEVTL